jgi:hypothetical protein
MGGIIADRFGDKLAAIVAANRRNDKYAQQYETNRHRNLRKSVQTICIRSAFSGALTLPSPQEGIDEQIVSSKA